eukprot:15003159-Alexandrium_andersonii.AAC.1
MERGRVGCQIVPRASAHAFHPPECAVAPTATVLGWFWRQRLPAQVAVPSARVALGSLRGRGACSLA